MNTVNYWLTLVVNQQERVLRWLSNYDVSVEHSEAVGIPKPGAGDWLLQSPEFEAWKKEPHSFLWLHGIRKCEFLSFCISSVYAMVAYILVTLEIADSEKTVLWWASCFLLLRSVSDLIQSATIIEHLKHNCGEADGLAYFYFNFRKGTPGDSQTCLRSLIAQLSQRGGDVPVVVWKLFERHLVDDELFDIFELVEVLLSLTRRQRRTFVIVEALDEASGRADMLSILKIMIEKKLENLHLLVSSRLELDIKECLEPIITASIGLGGQTLNDDVSYYIQRRIQDDPKMRKWEESLKREVETSLVSMADGRWVKNSDGSAIVTLTAVQKVSLGFLLPRDAQKTHSFK